MVLFFIGVWLPSPDSEALAAGCYGSSCNGYNPASMGCDGAGTSTLTSNTVGEQISKHVIHQLAMQNGKEP